MESKSKSFTSSSSDKDHRFHTTHWSMVRAAGSDESSHARDALEKLCKAYWHPLYAFVRREGASLHDAQDLVQGFLSSLIERDDLRTLDASKGRFRSFLLASMKHYLAHDRERRRTRKRGGDFIILSIDAEEAEGRFLSVSSPTVNSDVVFDRAWAESLLAKVMAKLEKEYIHVGKGGLFHLLKPTLTVGNDAQSYTEMARQSGLSEGAVKTAVHRFRRRYRELLRTEIEETVSSAEETEDELRYLVDVLSHDAG